MEINISSVYIQDKTSIFVQSDHDLLCSHRVTISEIELQLINQWSIQPDYRMSLIRDLRIRAETGSDIEVRSLSRGCLKRIK